MIESPTPLQDMLSTFTPTEEGINTPDTITAPDGNTFRRLEPDEDKSIPTSELDRYQQILLVGNREVSERGEPGSERTVAIVLLDGQVPQNYLTGRREGRRHIFSEERGDLSPHWTIQLSYTPKDPDVLSYSGRPDRLQVGQQVDLSLSTRTAKDARLISEVAQQKTESLPRGRTKNPEALTQAPKVIASTLFLHELAAVYVPSL